MLDMVRKICKGSPPERGDVVESFRKEAANCGYSLDDRTDAQLEAALSFSERNIEKLMPLTGRTIYWALRRLSPGAMQRQKRKIGPGSRSGISEHRGEQI
jgi:hypothetical protein